MKLIKTFSLFESNSPTIDSVYGKGVESSIKERLIDFQHLGFKTELTLGWSMVIDFARYKAHNSLNEKSCHYIRSNDLYDWRRGISENTVTINLRLDRVRDIDLMELEEAYGDLSHFMKSAFGLKPNYIMLCELRFISKEPGKFFPKLSWIYFETFADIRQLLIQSKSHDDVVRLDGLNLGFYKEQE